jgi:hypothetical protein
MPHSVTVCCARLELAGKHYFGLGWCCHTFIAVPHVMPLNHFVTMHCAAHVLQASTTLALSRCCQPTPLPRLVPHPLQLHWRCCTNWPVTLP